MKGVALLPVLLSSACLVAPAAVVARAQVAPGWVPLPAEQVASATAMVKAWTPGEAHARLAQLAGEWTFTSRLWLAPGMAPDASSGTASAVMLLGGRYLQTTIRGRLTGLPYEGVGVRAFDNTTGQHQSVWMDNLSSMLLFMTGSYDATARAYTMRAEVADLTDAATRVAVREVLTVVDADTHRVEMFETRGGETFKRLEFVFTRVR